MTDEATWFQYCADAEEALAEIEQSLLALESAADPASEVRRLYRGLHTIKGNSALLGLSNLEHLTHACEDMIGLVRDHDVPIGRHLVDLMLEVVDRLRSLIRADCSRRGDVNAAEVADLAERALLWIDAHGGIRAQENKGPKAYEIELWSAPPAASDPAADAEAIAIFLSLAREHLPLITDSLHQSRTAAEDETVRLRAEQALVDLRGAAERMGYAQVVAAIDSLLPRPDPCGASSPCLSSQAPQREVSSLELELYSTLARVEEQYAGLIANPESFDMSATYRRACADLARADLARLRTLLTHPNVLERPELVGIFDRLRAACEHLGYVAGSTACLDLGDRALRQLETGRQLDEAALDMLATLTGGIDRALRAVDDGRAPRDEPLVITPEAAACNDWPISEQLRSNLPGHARQSINELSARGYSLYEIRAHVECDVALAKEFERWARTSDIVLLSSAVVPAPPSEGGRGYLFLIASPLPSSVIESQLARIDGSPRLSVTALKEGPATHSTGGEKTPVHASRDVDSQKAADYVDRIVGGQRSIARTVTIAAGPDDVHVSARPICSSVIGNRNAEPPNAVAATQRQTPSHAPRGTSSMTETGHASTTANSSIDGSRTETASGNGDFLRINAQRVGVVMDLAGEIGLASSALIHHPELRGQNLEGFSATAHKLEMLIRELQNEVACMRLVPVAGVFQRMKRVVRDTARRTGKRVELTLRGEDTEIDKVMVDRLQDPLVHLLRNAIDHGIEAPDERTRLGKPAHGTIVLEASHRAGEVSIEVRDDGRGLDRERILARARERGLIGHADHPSHREIESLIFLPGFSTKDQIDEVSGRGVGMDVIKTTIEGLRGRIEVRSAPGQGSRANMTLPLTLAFLEAMIVRQGERLFAIPIEKVLEVFKVAPEQVSRNTADGETFIRVRGDMVKVMWLQHFYGEDAANRAVEREIVGQVVVVVQSSRGGLALPIDLLLGNQQIMLKPLMGPLAKIRAAAGYGMLRTGDVALALDCERLNA